MPVFVIPRYTVLSGAMIPELMGYIDPGVWTAFCSNIQVLTLTTPSL
jgi:hypothetical protein